MREIRAIIGMERTLHIQTIAEDLDGILRDADCMKSISSHKFMCLQIDLSAGEDITVSSSVISNYSLVKCLI